MCDFSGKLTAWIDEELPLDEAVSLEQHLETCPECQKRVAAYRQVSGAFAAYCDLAVACSRPKRRSAWIGATGATIAAGVLLALLFPRSRTETMMLPAPLLAQPPALAFKTAPAPVSAMHHVRQQKVIPAKNPAGQLDQPEIQIAFPADAFFPPGAIPAGFDFVANVSVAADGALTVGLRP